MVWPLAAATAQHVDFAGNRGAAAAHVVAEQSAGNLLVQKLPGAQRRGRRLIELLVIDEEERLAGAVVARQFDRSALADAELVELELRLGQAQFVAEEVVGVQAGAAHVVVARAGVPVGAGPRRKPDRDRSHRGAFGAGARAGDRDLLDRVQLRKHHRIKAVGVSLEVVVGVDAVDRDVDGRLRQAEERRIARSAWRGHAGQHDDETKECVARGQRQILNLREIDRGRHGRRLRLHEAAARLDLDGLTNRAHFERHRHVAGLPTMRMTSVTTAVLNP